MRRFSNLALRSLAVGSMLATSLLLAPNTARAEMIEVDSLADSGTGSLRAAVDKANITPGLDTITFEPGLTGTITLTTGEISITDDLIVDGSGAPSLTVSGNDASRIFAVETLAALTIEKMQLTAGDGLDEGGGAIISFSDVVIRSSVISSGSTGGSGGAVLSEGRVTVVASEIKDNFARRGGAIYASEVVIEGGSSLVDNVGFADGGGVFALSVFEMRDSFITGNSSCMSDGTMYGGGGVLSFADNVTISNSSFVGNSCPTRQGGGLRIHQSDAAVDIDDSTFEDNSADTGGGLYMRQATLTIDGSTFADNIADRAGAMMTVGGTAEVGSTSFERNRSGSRGGAIYASSTELTLTDSTFDKNVDFGQGGGAIYGETADIVVIATTFSSNDAEAGGAIFDESGQLSVAGGQFTDNFAQRGGAIAVSLGDGLVIDGATFRNNEATVGSGGAIDIEPGFGFSGVDGVVTVSAVSFHGNSAVGDGGAMSIAAATTATIVNVAATRNSADGSGGVIFAEPRPADGELALIVDGTTFEDNSADRGAAVATSDTTVAVSTSSFGRNRALDGTGGAIRVVRGSLTLADSTLTENSATKSAGALESASSAVTVTGSMFSGNSSGSSGGAISSFEGELTITGGEFADNTAARGGAVDAALAEDLSIDDVSFLRNDATAGDGGALLVEQGEGTNGELAVSDARFDGNESTGNGGAVRLLDIDEATFTDVVATDNSASGNGGALAVDSNEDTNFVRGTLNGNTSNIGGAIHSNRSDVDIEGSTLSSNAATDGGGAIHTNASVDIENSSFADNSAGGDGGAVEAVGAGGSTATEASTFSGNSAGGQGGAISGGSLFDGKNLRLERSSFVDNESSGPGGAVAASELTAESSTFARNQSGADGGAVWASESVLVTDSTFSANSATGQGGALAAESDFIYLFDVTVFGNRAGGSGGGIHDDTSTDAAVRNSIVSGNTAPLSPDIEMLSAPRRSIIGDIGTTPQVSDDGGVIDDLLIGVDPLLQPLANNGGPTLTHMLGARSPAIDAAGRGQTAPRPDQRGVIRDVGAGSDLGAVEYDGVFPVWVPVTPARLADTRSSGETIDGRFRAGGVIPAGQFVEIDIAGRGGVPEGATSAVVNITAINPSVDGFLSIYPCTDDLPNASSVNYTAGVNLPNEVVAGLSAAGSICVFSKEDTHIALDVVGYVSAGSPFVPVEPARLLDTRDSGVTIDGRFRAGGRRGARTELTLDVAGRHGIPANAAAVVVNVVAVRPSTTGFLTVHGCVDERPLSSSLNYVTGGNRANEILAGLDAEGRLCLYSEAATDLLVDVVGYLPAGTDLNPVEPARVYETRANTSTVDGKFSGGGKVAAGTTTRIEIAGRAGVSNDATSVNINVTAVAATAAGFATVYPCGERPLASSLNYIPGVNGGNDLVAELDADGALCVFNLSESHFTIDVSGYTTL